MQTEIINIAKLSELPIGTRLVDGALSKQSYNELENSDTKAGSRFNEGVTEEPDIWEIVNIVGTEVTLQNVIRPESAKYPYSNTNGNNASDLRYPVIGTLPQKEGINVGLNYTYYGKLSPIFRKNIISKEVTYDIDTKTKAVYNSKVSLHTAAQARYSEINADKCKVEWPEYREVYMAIFMATLVELLDNMEHSRIAEAKGLVITIEQVYGLNLTKDTPTLHGENNDGISAEEADYDDVIIFFDEVYNGNEYLKSRVEADVITENYSTHYALYGRNYDITFGVPISGANGLEILFMGPNGVELRNRVLTLDGGTPVYKSSKGLSMFQELL